MHRRATLLDRPMNVSIVAVTITLVTIVRIVMKAKLVRALGHFIFSLIGLKDLIY